MSAIALMLHVGEIKICAPLASSSRERARVGNWHGWVGRPRAAVVPQVPVGANHPTSPICAASQLSGGDGWSLPFGNTVSIEAYRTASLFSGTWTHLAKTPHPRARNKGA